MCHIFSVTNLTLSVKSCCLMEWNGLCCNVRFLSDSSLCAVHLLDNFSNLKKKKCFSKRKCHVSEQPNAATSTWGKVLFSNKLSCEEIAVALHRSTKQFMNDSQWIPCNQSAGKPAHTYHYKTVTFGQLLIIKGPQTPAPMSKSIFGDRTSLPALKQ